MIAFLATVAAEIFAGLVVWGVTEQSRQPTPNQSIYVQGDSTFITQVTYLSPPVIRRRYQEDDEGLGYLMILGVIAVIVLIVAASLAAVFVKYVNLVLTVTFWGAVIAGILSFILLVVGVIRGLQTEDWSTALISVYAAAVAAAFGVFVWLIFDPPNAPADLELVYGLLSQVDVGADGWTIDAFDIILDHGKPTSFLARQALGTVPFVISMALLLYLQVTVIYSLIMGETRGYSTLLLYSVPALAGVSSLLLGLFG